MTQLARTFDARFLNEVLNHPAVFKWCSTKGIDRLDLTTVAENQSNYVLMNEYGGFVFVPKGGSVYEVHTQFLPTGALVALSAAREAARYMFTQTDCESIVTYVPVGNRRAKRLTEAVGFEYTGTRGEWTYISGETVPIDWYELTKDRWQCQQQQS